MRTVLIANRGEIAVRVARACIESGLRSVAVYADDDADALHVAAADEARALGSAGARAYLDVDAVLRAARESGADAVHPGYGFLSESADFAESVIAAGLTWIGPPPAAMRLLGDKVSARRLAAEVGAPMAPGTTAPVADEQEVHAFAQQHGLPVAIKAAFGGGGRGLRVARTRDEIGPALASATSEAVSAFGRGECFVERWLDAPRHVEVQVLADAQRVVVVGTRDCSTQRRHQKLIEEAPAPFLTDAQDHELREGARAICARAGYTGAGTVEFLLGADGTLSFLEVNTRIQVEHTVSEETSGIDLVRAQLTIAAGGSVAVEQDPPARGHAIELRIAAEDPGRGFLPATGTITRWRVPGGPGVRVDSGVEEGSVVGPAFDSLLAKLVVVGENRDHAIARARRALDEMVIEGIPTVLPAHRAVVADEAFTAPDGHLGVHTGWVEEHLAERVASQDLPAPADELAAQERPLRRVAIEIDGRRVVLGLPTAVLGALGGASGGAGADQTDAGSSSSEETDPAVLACPSAGTLLAWLVEDGEHVEAGQEVARLEAMKMESAVPAHRAGRLAHGDVAVGASLGAGDPLARIET